jgi:hypothetical protein
MVDEHERGHRRQTNAQGHPRAAQDQPIELYAQCRLFVGGRARHGAQIYPKADAKWERYGAGAITPR